jgi:hypothetical protein
VKDEISDIDQKNKDIKTRKSEILSEMQRNRLKLESEKMKVTNLEAENKEKEKELQKLKSKRLKLIADSGKGYCHIFTCTYFLTFECDFCNKSVLKIHVRVEEKVIIHLSFAGIYFFKASILKFLLYIAVYIYYVCF